MREDVRARALWLPCSICDRLDNPEVEVRAAGESDGERFSRELRISRSASLLDDCENGRMHRKGSRRVGLDSVERVKGD